MGDESLADAPRHEVTLTKPFYLGRFEVTQGELVRLLDRDAPGRITERRCPRPS